VKSRDFIEIFPPHRPVFGFPSIPTISAELIPFTMQGDDAEERISTEEIQPMDWSKSGLEIIADIYGSIE
jgi:hypothetical protein